MQGESQMNELSNAWGKQGLTSSNLDGALFRKTYTYEEKLEAVRAHVEDGMSATTTMEKYGIRSKSAFFRWCDTYKREGAEGLRPKRRGRPRKNRD